MQAHRRVARPGCRSARGERDDAWRNRVEQDGREQARADAPVASAPREIVMSMRPLLTCCENVTFVPPDRRKLPSCIVRTRRTRGSNVTVIVTVDSRMAPVTEIGMLYGPWPTRSAPAGGERRICARPMPGDVIGGSEAVDAAGASCAATVCCASGGAAACGCTGCVAGAGGFGTTTVPGTGEPAGTVIVPCGVC